MDSVRVWLSIEDADIVQKIFERSDEPYFTIGHRVSIPELPGLVQLELGLQSSNSLWYLAQMVYMQRDFDTKIKESMANAMKIIDDRIKEFKNKIDE